MSALRMSQEIPSGALIARVCNEHSLLWKLNELLVLIESTGLVISKLIYAICVKPISY